MIQQELLVDWLQSRQPEFNDWLETDDNAEFLARAILSLPPGDSHYQPVYAGSVALALVYLSVNCEIVIKYSP